MKITRLLLFICSISLNTVLSQENTKNGDLNTAEKACLELPKIEVIPIKDTKADRQYELYIKLPEGYSENNDIQYPVLYTTDAMWHIELLSAATEYLIKDIILVGISWQKDIDEDLRKEVGTFVSRFRDYSLKESSKPEHQAKFKFGQASKHLDFIRNDVIKYVENNYRSDPKNRAYFGYSLGGLFGAYILLEQPDTFKNYILGSPSLWNDIPYLSELGSNETSKPKNLNANVFISNGTLEEELGMHVKEFVSLLKDRNDESLTLEHIVVEGDHQAAFPITGVSGVTWLSQVDNLPVLGSPYLGQKPPGAIPELFAPSIIKTDFREAEAAFTPDLKEFYFRRRGGKYKKNTLVVIQYKDNRWTESVVPPRAGEPFISPDGKILYLGNKYRTRTNSGWSEVKNLGLPFNDIPIMRLTVSSNGTYYFDEASEIGNIQYSRLINGKREKPRTLDKDIEMGKMKAHPFIAPDESYLIWDDEAEGGYGDNDLYISFRCEDGSWSSAINLGDKINTEFAEAFGSVTPDGKYFFFHRSFGRDTGDIFWVDAQIIQALRPK